MSATPKWPEPDWLAKLPPVEQEKARVRFYLCLAVIYSGSKHSPATLSRALGMRSGAINVMKTRGHVSMRTAIAIEELMGRELFPRELFCPALSIPE